MLENLHIGIEIFKWILGVLREVTRSEGFADNIVWLRNKNDVLGIIILKWMNVWMSIRELEGG